VGETEARDVLAEQGLVKVQCEFCQQEYRFDGPALDALFGPAGAGSTRH
jgi:molecular chaperone Hsp33